MAGNFAAAAVSAASSHNRSSGSDKAGDGKRSAIFTDVPGVAPSDAAAMSDDSSDISELARLLDKFASDNESAVSFASAPALASPLAGAFADAHPVPDFSSFREVPLDLRRRCAGVLKKAFNAVPAMLRAALRAAIAADKVHDLQSAGEVPRSISAGKPASLPQIDENTDTMLKKKMDDILSSARQQLFDVVVQARELSGASKASAANTARDKALTEIESLCEFYARFNLQPAPVYVSLAEAATRAAEVKSMASELILAIASSAADLAEAKAAKGKAKAPVKKGKGRNDGKEEKAEAKVDDSSSSSSSAPAAAPLHAEKKRASWFSLVPEMVNVLRFLWDSAVHHARTRAEFAIATESKSKAEKSRKTKARHAASVAPTAEAGAHEQSIEERVAAEVKRQMAAQKNVQTPRGGQPRGGKSNGGQKSQSQSASQPHRQQQQSAGQGLTQPKSAAQSGGRGKSRSSSKGRGRRRGSSKRGRGSGNGRNAGRGRGQKAQSKKGSAKP